MIKYSYSIPHVKLPDINISTTGGFIEENSPPIKDEVLIFQLKEVINTANFFSTLYNQHPLQVSSELSSNPFKEYVHKIAKKEKRFAISSLCPLYPSYDIFRSKKIRCIEFIDHPINSNITSLKEYRSNNVSIKIHKLDSYKTVNDFTDIKGLNDIVLFDYNFNKYDEMFILNIFLKLLSNLHLVLDIGGFLAIEVEQTQSQLLVDILSILSNIFEDVNIIKTQLQSNKTRYKFIICNKYTGTHFSFDNKQVGRLFSPLNEVIVQILLNVNKLNDKMMKDENKLYKTQIDKYLKGESIENFIYSEMEDVIMSNINLYMYLNLEIPLYITYTNSVIDEYISLEPVFVKIEIESKTGKQVKPYIDDTIERDLFIYKTHMDLLDEDKLSRFSNYVKISKFVKKDVSRMIKTNVSQAFLKMTEILNEMNLITSSKIETFHMCEAPGQFILAFDYYCFLHNIKYDWKANSLNHKSQAVIDKYGDVFADDYKLISSHQDRWLYGKDQTGDITNIDNIIEFSKNKYDIITSDCGLPHEYGFDEIDLSLISYCQMLIGLLSLKPHGSVVFKIFLPLTCPSNISMIYLLWKSFEHVYYVKPSLNPLSSEIYIVAINYQEIKNTKYLFDFMHNFDYTNWLFSTIDEQFIKQHIEITKQLVQNNKQHIFRTLIMFHYLDDKTKLLHTQSMFSKSWVRKYMNK